MTITFDSDRHRELVAALSRASDRIRVALDELEAQAAALRDAWSGEARHAYDRAQREWSQSMIALNDSLEAAVKSADTAGARLEDAEQAAVATWE